ncbi:hypothetical protein EP331_06290 [bacterium]|nr:MAG: hypothetical protein EP331_06290 [bacterium]
MLETLVAGKSTFKLQVPYKLIRTGDDSPKPLIVYFHGYGQDIQDLENEMASYLELDAYHLFIQGPFPLKLNPKDEKRKGFSYYIYDEHDDSSYLRSIEYTAEFIQEVVDHMLPIIKATRLTLVGYSMGAYLAGYWGFTRWKHTNDIVMLNGRMKAELFKSKIEEQDVLKHINVVAFHGKNDSVVNPVHQKEMIEYIAGNGIKASFIEVDGGHKLSKTIIEKSLNWLLELGYRKYKN